MMWPQRILSSALSRRAKTGFDSPARIRCFHISTPSDTSSVDEQLDQLADELEPTEYQDGEAIIGPDDGQDLESFQADVRRLRHYAAQGYFQIRREYQESMSSKEHVVRVQIRMGPEGVAWRKSVR